MRVVNYAQTENMDAARRVIDRLNAGGLVDEHMKCGVASPGLYEVVFTLKR